MSRDCDLISEENSSDLITRLLGTATKIFIKKLSNNDRDWARLKNKHQAGVYVPPRERDSGFFPALAAKHRNEPGAHEIREAWFQTQWPQFGIERKTRLVHYTSKGSETHMTGVPKVAFATLPPASWLIMIPSESKTGLSFVCLTIDSTSDEAISLADSFNLDASFSSGILEPALIMARERELTIDFAEQVALAWLAGNIASFASERAKMPATAELAARAREEYLKRRGLGSLNPFEIENPGDAIREISREIEWELFREFQRRERAVELIRAVLGDDAIKLDMKGVVRRLVDATGTIDAIMLSASQQRKSRAGYSFEHQIEAMLKAGGIPFAKQVVMDARKRPDFVLPSLVHLRKTLAGPSRGLILSAKTTLRERWKQVQREMGGSDLFLATVDETIASNAIEDMADLGIRLVVPESLKVSKVAEYSEHSNVVDFRSFFKDELKGSRIPAWIV